MIRTNAAAAVLLAAMLLLAGCAGGDSGATTETTATTEAPTTETTTEAPTTEATSTTAPETTTATTTTATSTPVPEMNETEAELRTMVIEAIDGVESYRERTSGNQTLSASGVTQTIEFESTAAYNRTNRTARINKTSDGPSGTTEVATYVVGGIEYKHSQSYVAQFGSEWVSAALSSDASSAWHVLDTISRQRISLKDARFDLVGMDTVDGTEAYVVRADVNETSFNEGLAQPNIDVQNATNTVWIAVDSHRLLKSSSVVETVLTNQGQEIDVLERIDKRFYDHGAAISITLPDGASDAIRLDED